MTTFPRGLTIMDHEPDDESVVERFSDSLFTCLIVLDRECQVGLRSYAVSKGSTRYEPEITKALALELRVTFRNAKAEQRYPIVAAGWTPTRHRKHGQDWRSAIAGAEKVGLKKCCWFWYRRVG